MIYVVMYQLPKQHKRVEECNNIIQFNHGSDDEGAHEGMIDMNK